MTQQDRDRLVALKKARKRLITQREAAAEIGQSERHVRRLLVKLKKEGESRLVFPWESYPQWQRVREPRHPRQVRRVYAVRHPPKLARAAEWSAWPNLRCAPRAWALGTFTRVVA